MNGNKIKMETKTKVRINKVNKITKNQFLTSSETNQRRAIGKCYCRCKVRMSLSSLLASLGNHGFVILFMISLLNLANLVLCNAFNNDNDDSIQIQKYANESLYESQKFFEDSSGMVWSQLLEDYVLSQGNNGNRTSKELPFINNMIHEVSRPSGYAGSGPTMINQQQQLPLSYHSSVYNRPNVYITKRIGEPIAELEPHMRPPIVNPQFRPMTNQMVNQEQRQTPGFLEQLFGLGGGSGLGGSVSQQHHHPQQPPPQQHRPPIISSLHQQQQQQNHIFSPNGGGTPFRPVSENDLYLLGAIEKMVYRVDYLESRIRRAEQLIYYLMAGNNQKEVKDPCPTNFTRISDNCYYINSAQQVNWKTANTACKGLGAHLAEFERLSENEEIIAYLLNQQNQRGRDFWLGGLNPGLLWIWSNSAKPVNPNMNLTSIAMLNGNSTETNLVDHEDKEDENDKKDSTNNAAILNNTLEIKGQGRCLRLTYNNAKHTYAYFGQECTSRHHYICEFEDKTLDNKIKKIARNLKLFD